MTKYRNTPTMVDGIEFDSKAEARHYAKLLLLERAGLIKDLKRQVVFQIADAVQLYGRKRPAIKYIADFTYEQDGKLVVCDVKGMLTPVYRLKRHLMKLTHGIEIQEVA